jgi:Inosine-uridine preferring nucleoside hydrolase
MVGGPSVVCDPGVDDFLALLVLAGAGVPPSDVVGTAGNVDAELAFRNAAGIVSVLGLDRSVAKGCEEGLSGPYPDTGEPFHGTDGLGGIGSVLRVAAPGTALDPVLIVKGTVLATGPVTIVATALSAGNAIEDIVWMGGTVACGGNMTPSAEFNAWLDPEAADQVLSSSKSLGHGLSRRGGPTCAPSTRLPIPCPAGGVATPLCCISASTSVGLDYNPIMVACATARLTSRVRSNALICRVDARSVVPMSARPFGRRCIVVL